MNPKTSRIGTLLGTASLISMASAMAAHAQQVAQAPVAQTAPQEVPEQVLITGSLIRGTAQVGVPVTNLSQQDFTQSGSLTTADLFRTVPAAITSPGPVATQSGANMERATRVNLRGLDTGDLTRSLLMVDGMRMPPQGNGVCEIDPSIIPQLALDRIDVLVDGASAQYGSDAMAGVINIILRRGFDGAVTRLQYTHGAGGRNDYLASQLWGRTWDGGDITLAYEWYDDSPVYSPASNWTIDFTPWGLDNRIPLASSAPGTISTGNPRTANNSLPGNLGTSCTNCFAIPHGTGTPFAGGIGPTAPGSGSTLMWDGTTFQTIVGTGGAASFGTLGTANEFNPYDLAYFEAQQQRNAATMTVDQRLTKDITFSGEAFYSNRRAEFINPSNLSPSAFTDLSVQVPTWNPYYPIGTGVPTNINVNINMAAERPSRTAAFEVAARYEGGFNIDLPYDWEGRIYLSQSYDSNQHKVIGTPNRNAVSAALGWTIGASPPAGTAPGIASWTKPATMPYLNLFCDQTEISGCNSWDTLNYISGVRYVHEQYWINEKGATFDGPIFDLPGGALKGAIGGTYTTARMQVDSIDNTGKTSLLTPLLQSTDYRSIWAVFGQLNIPIFSDMNAIPLFQRLELEASWRHDQYSDTGGTSNPKIAFTWQPHDWFTIRGSWGTNFVAPGFGQIDPLANNNIQAWNVGSLFSTTQSSRILCTTGADPVSGAGKLVAGGAPCTAAGSLLPGVSQLGSSTVSVIAGLRDLANQNLRLLHPETSTNWGVGFDFAPTTTFLKGLDIQATWYQVKINGTLQSFGNPTTDSFSSASKGFAFIVPSDLAAPLAAQGNAADAAACAAADATPWTCPEFVSEVTALLSNPRNSVNPQLIPAPGNTASAYWINDGGTVNQGWSKISGIDFNASYDWDLGDFGAWNVGIVGTYYLHRYIASASGGAAQDVMHTTLNSGQVNEAIGVESIPRLAYRGRLGWSNGPYTVTAFVNHKGHFFQTQSPPANVNGNFCLSNGVTPAPTDPTTGEPINGLPCNISNYSNIEPPTYTFDLALGYDTGDDPANDYLKHIAVQFVVQNIFDKHAGFEYRTSTGGGNPAAYDITAGDAGRIFSIILTKSW